MHTQTRRILFWWFGGLLFLVLGLLPMLRPEYFAQPLFAADGARLVMKGLLAALPPLAVFLLMRRAESSWRRVAVPALVCLLGACFAGHIHHQFVDKGSYLQGTQNAQLQLELHRQILAFDPGAIPHSYRFLSTSIVSVFEWLCGSFTYAQHAYRILFQALLLGMVYRLARLYLDRLASVFCVLFLLLLYPVTIAWYIGQSLDPVSHLSFIVCFYLLAKGSETGMVPTLVLGVLAKESVAAAAFGRIFFGEKRRKAFWLTCLYGAIAVSAVVLLRILVPHSHEGIRRVSGVGFSHIFANLKGWDEWSLQYLFSLLVLLPGAVLGWGLMPRDFRRNALFVTLALVVSSAFFSWLNEVRNLVPAMVLLLIIKLRYLEARYFKRETPQGL